MSVSVIYLFKIVNIKNSNTAIFSMENFDLTIREGYDCVMACKDDLLRIFSA